MNILLFIAILIIAFIIVRIGAIAFELTGLEWSLAKFQALSCYTGTGFTTKEAELITGHPQRRNIASFLIILGHAGFVTLIATFANSLRPNVLIPEFTMPFLRLVFPSRFLPLVNFFIIVIAVGIIYKIFTQANITKRLSDCIRNFLVRKAVIKRTSFEELTLLAEGYGVSSVDISSRSPMLDKSLIEAQLRKLDITVLAIQREGKIIPNPAANRKIILDDKIICFGKLANIRGVLSGE